MKQTWLYTYLGKTCGPASSAEIAKLVLEGKLEPDSTVQSSVDQLWKKISTIKEITDIYHQRETITLSDEDTARQFQTFLKINPDGKDSSPIFYNINWKTLFFLNMITGNLTTVVWFYWQWKYLKNHRKDYQTYRRVSFWFFNYDIFCAIERHPEFMRIRRAPYNSAHLAILEALLIVSPSTGFGIGWIEWLLYAIVYVGIGYTIIPVQKYINECNQALGRS